MLDRSSVFGRDGDVDAIDARFAAGDRLVNLVGVPGVGKTTVARAFAERAREAGVRVVTVEGERSTLDALASSVRQGLHLDPEALPRRVLGDVGESELLVVIDEAERLTEPSGLLEWLAESPSLRILTTSRKRLGLGAGESVIEILPLRTSGHDSPAVAMFLDLARRARPSFAASDDALVGVAELVEVLEGIPLALELAAARMAIMGPRDLLDRIASKGTELPTMERSLERSWEMLHDEERSVLAQCTVFRGGFTIAAADAIVELSSGRVVDVLQRLREQSLIRTEESGSSVRLTLHRFVREFAERRLLDLHVDGGALQRRHAEYFLGQRAAAADRYDVAAALDHALATEVDPRARAHTLHAATAAILAHGPLGDHERRLEACLEALPDSDPMRLPLLEGLAKTYRMRGRFADALDVIGRIKALAPAGDFHVRALFEEATLRLFGGDDAAAAAILDSALTSTSSPHVAMLRTHLHLQRGALDETAAAAERSAMLARRANDPAFEGGALGLVALVELERGRARQAAAHVAEAIRLASDSSAHLEAYLRGYAGCVAHETGDVVGARRAYTEALGLIEAHGDRRAYAWLVSSLGAVSASEGDLFEAARALDEGRLVAASTGDRNTMWIPHYLSGVLFAARARTGDARALESARSLLAEARTGAPVPFERSWDVRFAVRLIEAAIATSSERARITIAGDGRWFAIDDGPRVSIAKHAALPRLLAHLAERAKESSAEPVAMQELVGVGWPGERVQRLAGANRVHVALARLRGLGLRKFLVRAERGYRLEARVERAD